MRAWLRLAMVFCFALLPASLAGVNVSYARGILSGVGSSGFVPAPTLLSPATEDVDLSGRVTLEFKWERSFLGSTDYFDFRLYNGYVTSEDSLILKQRYGATDYPVTVEASKFEAGQVYTWVLRQVFDDGRKSDKASSSFTVVRK